MEKLVASIKNIPSTGNCELDINKACKYFTKDSLVSKYNNNYRLMDKTPKTQKFRLKVTISESNAMELIERLRLQKVQDPIFKNAFIYQLESGQ